MNSASPPAKPFYAPLLRPLDIWREYDWDSLNIDLMAGLTVAVVLLPQAIAFALIAELPPQMGLYAAVMGAFFGALWGSSNQIHTGPTNAISILVLSALSAVAVPGQPDYIVAAGLLALMVGVFQVGMGLAKMGVLVNFVSHSVVVGFTAGAGLLIIIKQIPILLGVQINTKHVLEALQEIATRVGDLHPSTFSLGVFAMFMMIGLRRWAPKAPAALLAMTLASIAVFAFGLADLGVSVIGELPASLPPLVDLVELVNIDLISELSAGALAVGAIGLVETSAVARSIAAQTGQRLDNNQEFVGQGIGNLVAGLFSGYPVAGSFSRSALNFNAGARSGFAAVASGFFVMIGMFVLAPLAVYLPRAALAGVLIVTAYRLIDRKEMTHIWNSAREDGVIMLVTFIGTLVLEIEFAVLAGIMLSLAVYIRKTSVPHVVEIVPETDYAHLQIQTNQESCPQLIILGIKGDLYFGAVSHVEDSINNILSRYPGHKYVMLNLNKVINMDVSGLHMLETIVDQLRDKGGDMFLTKAHPEILLMMQDAGFYEKLGWDNYLDADHAIEHLFYKVLDPIICIYECPIRVFKECQNLPKSQFVMDFPEDDTDLVPLMGLEPQAVWEWLQTDRPPLIVDIREPREYQRGHVPNAELVPLPMILSGQAEFPQMRDVTLVCRTGRRSARAIKYLQQNGHTNINFVAGGIVAWEKAGLLQAFDLVPPDPGDEGNILPKGEDNLGGME